jgi:NADH-quinone oxidoreductase subunit N
VDPTLLSWIISILPQILLLVLGLVVLVVDLAVKPEWRRNLGWVTAVGMALIMLVSVWLSRPPDQGTVTWGGMLRWDWMSFVFQMLFVFGAAMTALFAMDVDGLGDRGEFYILLIASTIGMTFLAGAANLIMLYLSLETIAIPLYVLAGFIGTSDRSVEAGFKYLLFGIMASAVMLYGFTLLYGATGKVDIYAMSQTLMGGQLDPWLVIGSFILILVGFGFKISIFPLHFWAPDVYEGAPTPVAGFLSTASKAAGFAVLIRVLFIVFANPRYNPESIQIWGQVLTWLAVFTMTWGNLLALTQKNIKRLLAYSSIAHAGYALIGIASVSGNYENPSVWAIGITSTIFYLITYLVTNLAAFGIVSVYSKTIGSDEIKDYAGMSRRSPGLALLMLVTFLSLAGMPPFAGFIAKFLVFAAAVQANLIWLAVVGVLNSIVGLYYYLVVLKVAYLYHSEDEDKPAQIPSSARVALGFLVAGIVLLGTLFSPWLTWALNAMASIF